MGQEVTSYELVPQAHGVLSLLYKNQGPWTERLTERPPLELLRDHLIEFGDYDDYMALTDSILIAEITSAGRWEEADQILERCLEAYAELTPAQAFLRTYLAELRSFQGRWDEATEQLDVASLALEQYSGSDPSPMWFEANCRVSEMRGRVELALGHLIPAHVAFTQGIDWARQYQEATDAAVASGDGSFRPLAVYDARIALAFGMAELLLFTERHAEVIDKLIPFLDDDFLQDEHRAKIQVELGLAYTALEIADPTRPPKAEAILQEAIDGGWLSESYAFHMMALLTSARKNLIEANVAGPRADQIATAEHRIEQARTVLSQMQQGGLEELLPLREVALFHALSADLALAKESSSAELEEQLQAFEEALMDYIGTWTQVPAAPGGIGILHDARRRVILDSYFGLCFALDQGERALAKLLEIQIQGTMARALGVEDTTLAEIQSELVAGGGVLVYLPTFSRTQLWLVDQEGVEMKPLAISGRELRAMNRAVEFVPANLRAESQSALALRDELVPEFARQRIANWSHVYIVGADLLDNPPFEILPYGESSMGREMALVHLPSLPIGVHLAKHAPAAQLAGKDAIALFAGPTPSDVAIDRWPSIGPISVQRGSWEDLTDSFTDEQSAEWLEEQATRAAFLARFHRGEGGDDETKVLSLFCHGVFDFETEDLPAGLVLGASGEDDGLVWASDVTEGIQAPALVVLAACGTSKGPQRRGENGMANLGGAFLHAGASTVIMAGGSLEVEAAFALTEVLHRELARGETVAEALRIARQELGMERGNGGLGVALSILGVGHRPLFLAPEQSGRGLTPWVLGGLAAVGAGFVLLRRKQSVSA